MHDSNACSDTFDASRKVEETFFGYKENDPIIERNKQLQHIHNTISKAQAHSIKGMILHCVGCKELFSTTEIVNMALIRHCEMSSSSVTFPLEK